MTQNFWRIFIDWDGDGTRETNEAGRCQYVYTQRGRERLINTTGTGLQEPPVGKATLVFDNYDFRYDPFKTTSPLYPNVAPGRKIQIGVETGGTDDLLLESGDKLLTEASEDILLSDGTFSALFTGRIDDLQPQNRRLADRFVKVRALDNWRDLRDKNNIRVDLQTSITTADAIDDVLDAAGWPAADRTLTGDGDTVPYWWATGDSAAHEVWSLVESDFGQVYFSGDGKLTYTSRQSLFNDTAADTITEDEVLKNIGTPYPWDLIRNNIQITTHPLTEQSTIQLWKLYDKPLILAGTTKTIFADLTYEDRPVIVSSLTTPASTTDYTANAQEDGGGADLTANISITATTYGRQVQLDIENTGATDAYLTLMKLRGDALDAPTVTVSEANDTSSQDDYSLRTLNLDLEWQQSTETGQDFADYLAGWMKDPLLVPVLRIQGRESIQFTNDLCSRLTLDLDTLELDADYFISWISHEWLRDNGQLVHTEWKFEPVDMAQYWEFTTSIGVSSRFAY